MDGRHVADDCGFGCGSTGLRRSVIGGVGGRGEYACDSRAPQAATKKKEKIWNTINFLRKMREKQKKKKERKKKGGFKGNFTKSEVEAGSAAGHGCVWLRGLEPWPRAQRTSELQARDAITIMIKDKKRGNHSPV